jgi:thioredoxin-like negative regulator of GroEL
MDLLQAASKGSSAGGSASGSAGAKKHTLHLFHVSWCPYCTSFKPVWDGELTSSVEAARLPVKLNAVDAEKDPEAAGRYQVRQYPTIVLESPDGSYQTYSGPRTPVAILDFLRQQGYGEDSRSERSTTFLDSDQLSDLSDLSPDPEPYYH